jgi:hypothetical protein
MQMRTYKLTIAAAAALYFPVSAFAQGIHVGPNGVQIDDDRYHEQTGYRECRELRRACMHKEELGEQGEGNCRRYRQLCQR